MADHAKPEQLLLDGSYAPPGEPAHVVQVSSHVRRIRRGGKAAGRLRSVDDTAETFARAKWLKDTLDRYIAALSSGRARRAEYRNLMAKIADQAAHPMTVDELAEAELSAAVKLSSANLADVRVAFVFSVLLETMKP